MDKTIIIMAAGMGSRYGGIKQMDPVGPNGELLISYSISDAIKAGFNKVVIVLRPDIFDDFKEFVGDEIGALCAKHGVSLEYTLQEMDKIPEGYEVPEGRTKPWGTCQAILAAKDLVNEPFVTVNADDYYGPGAFEVLAEAIETGEYKGADKYAMVSYLLKNTVSEKGTVTRGVCRKDADGYLADICETKGIGYKEEGSDVLGYEAGGEFHELSGTDVVSMNMWLLTPDFFGRLEKGFVEFMERITAEGGEALMKSEFLLPIYIGELLEAGEISVRVYETDEKWFGMTYKEDWKKVSDAIAVMIAEGKYASPLI